MPTDTLQIPPEPPGESVVLDATSIAWQRSTGGGEWFSTDADGEHDWVQLLTKRGPVRVIYSPVRPGDFDAERDPHIEVTDTDVAVRRNYPDGYDHQRRGVRASTDWAALDVVARRMIYETVRAAVKTGRLYHADYDELTESDFNTAADDAFWLAHDQRPSDEEYQAACEALAARAHTEEA